MAQKILGLDLGSHAVKAVVLEGTGRNWEVRSFATAVIPPAPPAPVTTDATGGEGQTEASAEPAIDTRLSMALEQIASQIGGLRADVVSVALPGAAASSPFVTLPFTEAKKIEATLGFEVESLLPFDLDEAVYDHQILSQQGGKSDLLVGVARRAEVASTIAALRASGIDPRVVTLPGLALQPLATEVALRDRVGAEENVAILDIGHERSVLTVVRGGNGEKNPPALVFTRTFSGGAAELVAAVQRDLGLDRFAAERWLNDNGNISGESAEAALLRRALMPVIREVRQSLRAAQGRSRDPIVRLHLAGAIAGLRGLPEMLTRDLGVQAEALALPGDAAKKIGADRQPELAQALGLALRGLARGGKLLNFRKGELAYKGDLDYLKGKVSRLVAFAAVIVLLLGANVWAKLQTISAQEEKLDAQLCEITQKVLGTCEKDFNLALAKLQGGGSKAAQIPTASAMEVFSDAANQMPAGAGLKLQEVDVTLDRLRLRGIVDSFDGVDQIVGGLKQSRCIGDVKRGRVQRNREEKIEFTLDALYVCGQNADKAAGEKAGG